MYYPFILFHRSWRAWDFIACFQAFSIPEILCNWHCVHNVCGITHIPASARHYEDGNGTNKRPNKFSTQSYVELINTHTSSFVRHAWCKVEFRAWFSSNEVSSILRPCVRGIPNWQAEGIYCGSNRERWHCQLLITRGTGAVPESGYH